jgi:hypothetical protein
MTPYIFAAVSLQQARHDTGALRLKMRHKSGKAASPYDTIGVGRNDGMIVQ